MLVLYFVCICQRLPRHNQSVHNSTTFFVVFYPLPKSNVANIIEFYIAKEKILRGNFPNNITVHNFRKQRNKMYSRDI